MLAGMDQYLAEDRFKRARNRGGLNELRPRANNGNDCLYGQGCPREARIISTGRRQRIDQSFRNPDRCQTGDADFAVRIEDPGVQDQASFLHQHLIDRDFHHNGGIHVYGSFENRIL